METTNTEGIKNAQARLRGYVLGVSYEMIDLTYKTVLLLTTLESMANYIIIFFLRV